MQVSIHCSLSYKEEISWQYTVESRQGDRKSSCVEFRCDMQWWKKDCAGFNLFQGQIDSKPIPSIMYIIKIKVLWRYKTKCFIYRYVQCTCCMIILIKWKYDVCVVFLINDYLRKDQYMYHEWILQCKPYIKCNSFVWIMLYTYTFTALLRY